MITNAKIGDEVKIVACKFRACELEGVESVARRFGLTKSEIIRRAVAEGLKSFESASFPGSPVERREARS